jgi:glycosyltransferase involved in cell wall biosynthesis
VTFPFFKNFTAKKINRLLSFKVIRLLFIAIQSLWLYFLIRKTRPEVFLVSNIYAAPLCRAFARGKLLTYDCNDDHLGFPNTPLWATKYFRSVCEQAHKIIGVAESMRELIPIACQNKFIVIGNGVDSNLFVWKRPALIYAGAISEWLDFDLLAAIADNHKDKVLVIAGFVATTAKPKLELLTLKANVRYLGEMPHTALPAIFAACDVGLIPFLSNKLTLHLNPNKLYEYFAAGLPIVSTDLSSELRNQSAQIYLAVDHKDFIEKIGFALTKPKVTVAQSRAIAAKNDWNAKAQDFANVILQASTLFKA